jgi:cytochrome c553
MPMKYLSSAAALALMTLAAHAADLPAGAEKAETCFACHGPAGISQIAETPSLAGQPDGFLQWQLVYFRSGTRKSPIMQPMAATLTDTDIRGLAKYFASQKPAPADTSAPVEAAMFAVGQKIAQQNRCASCHKDDFSGVQATPRIANQREDYLLKSLRDFKSGARTGGGVAAMADVVYPLGDDELRGLAYFMGHFGAPAAKP